MTVLSDILDAARHGASMVYHDIVAVEDDVTAWVDSHPEVGPLLQTGITYAEKLLTAAGIPVPSLIHIGDAVMGALKDMAASDPTLISGGRTSPMPGATQQSDAEEGPQPKHSEDQGFGSNPVTLTGAGGEGGVQVATTTGAGAASVAGSGGGA